DDGLDSSLAGAGVLGGNRRLAAANVIAADHLTAGLGNAVDVFVERGLKIGLDRAGQCEDRVADNQFVRSGTAAAPTTATTARIGGINARNEHKRGYGNSKRADVL